MHLKQKDDTIAKITDEMDQLRVRVSDIKAAQMKS
jgi:hypothetical protein